MTTLITRSASFAVIGLILSAGIASADFARAASTHALLIGIDRYAPPEGYALPVAGSGHKNDSRFAPNTSWPDLEGPKTDVASMYMLLHETYGFTDIRELTDEQATRHGILEALDQLISDTHKGDLVIVYYSGHGSQRLDTKSSKDQRDQTIVPVDAWKGIKDIRDKELAVLFNRIVYDKQARLTAIFDSCNSGTLARGITASVQRTLPYDDDDVAKERGAITEGDLHQVPQRGDAILLAAAGPTQAAVEARYPEDGLVHGAFTRALIRVLRQNSQALSAEDVVAATASLMHADPLDFQQPSVEGRMHESLFGDPVVSRALHGRVIKISGQILTLDVGSAAGFGVGTQFSASESRSNEEKVVAEIFNIKSPTISEARIINPPATAVIGEILEISSRVYPQAARLVLFVPRESTPMSRQQILETRALFSGLTWIDEPTEKPIDYLVMQGAEGWMAYGRNGRTVRPGAHVDGVAFLSLGPPPLMLNRIRRTQPFQRGAFRITDKPGDANYLLITRMRPNGSPEYSLLDPRVLASRSAAEYVRSNEEDPEEARINDGVAPEVVCRRDVSFPVRTAWLHDASAEASEDSIAPILTRRILRLGKLRIWEQMPALVSGVSDWPYRLQIASQSTSINRPLHALETYDIRLEAGSAGKARPSISPKYIYLFGFDCAANPYQLYPTEETNGVGLWPQAGSNGEYPVSGSVISMTVNPPYGADTLFLLATKEKITNLTLLTYDGVIESGRGSGSGLDQLMTDLNDSGSRGPTVTVSDWQAFQLVVSSQP